jgi:hypothetical protein
VELLLDGDELLPAVGVSHYQPALIELSGRRADEEVRVQVRATLVPEPDNPHDPNAVAVRIDEQLVGYLARDYAKRWQPIVRTIIAQGDVAVCEAMIAGRGPGSGTSNLGVFLRLPTPTEGQAQVGIRYRD